MDESQRQRAIRRVLLIEMALNLVVAVTKAVYGYMTNSLAIGSDAVHSFVDAGSNAVGLAFVVIAAAPPDQQHPYGHRKLEAVAAMGLGVAIGLAGVRFGMDAVEALFGDVRTVRASLEGFAVLGATLVVNIFIATYEGIQARRLNSPYLAADAMHTASDVLVTLGVLGSFAATYAGVTWADPVGALLVICVIAWAAWRVVRANLNVLTDVAALDPAHVHDTVMAVDGVRGCHRVRSRGSDAVHVDLHVLVDDELPLRAAHDIAHDVERALKERFDAVVEVLVHIEPESDGAEPL